MGAAYVTDAVSHPNCLLTPLDTRFEMMLLAVVRGISVFPGHSFWSRSTLLHFARKMHVWFSAIVSTGLVDSCALTCSLSSLTVTRSQAGGNLEGSACAGTVGQIEEAGMATHPAAAGGCQ